MTKAPRRRVNQPAGGGASWRNQPRGADGCFVKRQSEDDVAQAAEIAAAPVEDGSRRRTSTPAQLVARVTRAIERELAQIEDIVGGPRLSASKRTEAEKRARTLASLARTLAEVTKLRGAAEAKPDHDDDAGPRDLDEFRRTLERRLAQIADPPEIATDRGDDAT